MGTCLGLDIGSNSVGSAWRDEAGNWTTATSVFPAGVDESDDKRGDPKNAKRRMTRRTRITLRRRAERKRLLRLKLIETGLLPADAQGFKVLLETTDPWALRTEGLDRALSPYEFGRVLLHLSQRRGALGLKIADAEEEGEEPADADEDGKVKAAISAVRSQMAQSKARTFGEFIQRIRNRRITPITTKDLRSEGKKKGPRQWRGAIRNKAGSYEHCADRAMIRHEFNRLWEAQKEKAGELSALLTPQLRAELDCESGDSTWRHKGLLFGQRRQSWDLGTLGRCVLEPTERCAPHADRYASAYRVVETINNLRIIERGREDRPLTVEERQKIKVFLSGPLGTITRGKLKGRPKQSASITDLRDLMGWGRTGKSAPFRFNFEDSDEEREINTDWFSREIVHGAVTVQRWEAMSEKLRDGLNRAILKYDPDNEADAAKLRAGAISWAGLTDEQADALLSAWRRRPRPDSKRLKMSRRAVRNLMVLMDRPEPWPDPDRPGVMRWLTQIEARKLVAQDADFCDATTGRPLDEATLRRYATGAKGATARDRHYMKKHKLVLPDGQELPEPPPAPMISNPVVRKAIHEVRRHLIEYMTTFGRKPDEVHIELSREAKMGKKDADELLFKNRLRNRIRRDIINTLDLHSVSSTQQRAAVDRVILAVQQGFVCPLCGESMGEGDGLSLLNDGCEIAHILPRAGGGHNGLGNIVLAHTRCNRDMARRTPRQFWVTGAGFEKGMSRVELIYGDVRRPKSSEIKSTTGNALWSCYFEKRDDLAKIRQFKKDIRDIQGMTQRQDAATKYATRQVMAYLADALFDGDGLPERGGNRRIFATDGMWTSRLRREWGLFFDPHHARDKGLQATEEHHRKEKNRGDHRHHAVDAVVIALCTRQVQLAWDQREKQADADGINTADEVAMENYRKRNPLAPPSPFATREEFRQAVRRAVFGEGPVENPICHRPVKRKLIGALHEETLLGPVVNPDGGMSGNYTAKKSVLALTPNHLRMPEGWDERSAQLEDSNVSTERKNEIRMELAAMVDPPPTISGLVRDRALRDRLRKCLRIAGLDPDAFTLTQMKPLCRPDEWKLCHASGVPIRSVVLLRTMTDPVIIPRKLPEYATDKMRRDDDPASLRAYVGGNNHHIEIRAAKNKKGSETWSGVIVTGFEAARRKLARIEAIRAAGVPRNLRKLPRDERAKWKPALREAEQSYPLVDRRDDDRLGGRFVMSLSEGEMLFMKHKHRDEVGYFVVAKLTKPQRIVLVPHWDARSATERKDAQGNKVADSGREDFSITPNDLRELAPPGHDHAVKVRVSPMGKIRMLQRD